MDSKQSKQALRRQLRTARRNLGKQVQIQASIGVCRQLINQPAFLNGQRIGIYFSNDGEVNLEPLINAAWKMGKTLYLPVLHPIKAGELVFMEYQPEQPMAKNRFGIPEPVSHRDTSCPLWLLDLVLTPLVGFDEIGNRMGMGGGFYDRSFAFLRTNTKPRKPALFGVAHECQKAKQLKVESWDIPMDAIVTGSRTYMASRYAEAD
ncbi:MAG: 5-formyltetrahydrofolate cyclo-ligase [Gammaproteobacteria bacterium]|nr:MAG: 5-formyltetrahydrofolate cyclo-ligase [Gammaproteobacteria bacterium]